MVIASSYSRSLRLHKPLAVGIVCLFFVLVSCQSQEKHSERTEGVKNSSSSASERTSSRGSSEQLAEIRKPFRDAVMKFNVCASDEECDFISAPCPLGCYAPVSKKHKPQLELEVEKVEKRLVEEGLICKYDCPGPPQFTCASGRCQPQ